MIVTFSDAVDYALNYLAKDAESSPEAKRIVINAYRSIANKRDWNYYKRVLRLTTNAAQTYGTVQYTASTNQLVLSGSTMGVVANATNTSPIEINSPGHRLQTGQVVSLTGVLGNTAANGTFTITIVDGDNFDLNGSTGNGAYTSGGTWSDTAGWPAWVLSGVFRFGYVLYAPAVNGLINSTTLQFDSRTLPNVDYAPGTPYVLYQDAYPLPQDFRSIIGINWQAGTYNPAYIDLEEFMMLSTLVQGPSAPAYFTIYGDRQLLGIKSLRFYPPPDLSYPTNLYYNGAGRPLQIEYARDGTVSTTQGTWVVNGSATLFTQAMVGSVIRFSSGQLKDTNGAVIYPTGFDGLYPPVMEHIIVAVNSPTSLILDTAAELTVGPAYYQVSDPIDLPEGAMVNYFYRECDYQARRSMRSKDIDPEEGAAYKQALEEAMEADSVFGGTRVATPVRHRPRLMREYPLSLNG